MSWVEKPDAKAESSSLQLLSNDQAANAPEIDAVGRGRRLNGSATVFQVF